MRSAREYRRIARARLSGNWGIAVAASVVAGLLGAGGSSVSVPTFDFSSLNEAPSFSESLPNLPWEENLSLPVLSGIFVILLNNSRIHISSRNPDLLIIVSLPCVRSSSSQGSL